MAHINAMHRELQGLTAQHKLVLWLGILRGPSLKRRHPSFIFKDKKNLIVVIREGQTSS